MQLGCERMRKNIYLSFITFGFIISVVSISPSSASADDNMHLFISECIEINIKAELDGKPYTNIQNILEQSCLGSETKKCHSETESGFSGYNICIDKESAAWRSLKQEFFDQLLSNPLTQATRETLLRSDKASEDSSVNDCNYVALRWGFRLGGGPVPQAITEGSICNRDKTASRAILYRIWLYDAKVRLGG